MMRKHRIPGKLSASFYSQIPENRNYLIPDSVKCLLIVIIKTKQAHRSKSASMKNPLTATLPACAEFTEASLSKPFPAHQNHLNSTTPKPKRRG